MKQSRVYALMVMSAFFWAGAFIAGKFSVDYLSPVPVTFLRFSIAAAIIFVVLAIKEPQSIRLTRKQFGIAALLGLVGMVGYHILFFKALSYTSAVNASLIVATNPMLTAFLSAKVLGERIDKKKYVFLFTAFMGVFLTISEGSLAVIRSVTFNTGDLIMIVAVLCWVVYSVLVKRAMKHFTPLQLTTYSFVFCTMYLLPFVIRDNYLQEISNAPVSCWVSVIYMATLPTVVAYLMQQVAIREIGATRTNLFINLVPVFSILLSLVVLRVDVSIIKVISALVIIVSVYLFNRKKVSAKEISHGKSDASGNIDSKSSEKAR